MKLVYINPETTAKALPCYKDYGNEYSGFCQHTHTQHEISYVALGQLIDTYRDTISILEPRQLCFIRANDIHSTQPINPSSMLIYTINIPTALFNKVLAYYDLSAEDFLKGINHPKVTVPIEEHNVICKMFDRLSQNRFDEKHGRLMSFMLSYIIYLFTNPYIKEETQRMPPFLSQLLLDMSAPSNFTAGLPKLLELANYSKEYVSRSFKKYLNMTPTKFINNMRLDYAAKLLATTEQSILDIYLASGFQNEGHFYKLFNERFHMSPMKFRKMNKIG